MTTAIDFLTSQTNNLGSNDTVYKVPIRPVDATTGAADIPYHRSRITEDASRLVLGIADKGMVDRINKLLRSIDLITYSLEAAGRDLSVIPPVRPSVDTSGSLTLEWTSPDFRFGFTFERIAGESGWYFATSKRLGEIGAFGLLTDLKLETLAVMINNFVVANT
jgi:hypothetical protein